MSLFNNKVNTILEKTRLNANELCPGDFICNTNPECKHFKSKGIVLKVKPMEDETGVIGNLVRYIVLNNGPTYKKGDCLDKTEIQLDKLNPRPNIKPDRKQLAMGIKVEMEHTDNKKVAKTIALQHLAEDPKYYSKLKKVEGNLHH